MPATPEAFFRAQSAPRSEECRTLDALFRRCSGLAPELWPGNKVGYGRYDYTYATGRSGTYLATGFSPRKAALSIYIMPGYADFSDILSRLGPHRMGKSCLYVTRLNRIDTSVLGDLIAAGLSNLRDHWPVRA
ncbi:DUF1801 domain-containing protein [Jannaschia sp. M317]|uniref:DUF1801 domain-containing protein n=1 Tax=Jannaschia sp. M317 TaxID=2867011 RepID=UPI0021A89F7F|nr:DUF1801 domain-containing protein [Jannaschia sp. M317]